MRFTDIFVGRPVLATVVSLLILLVGARSLALLEIPFNVNHRLVRGLDYYTRTVFEVQPQGGGAQSTIGGGGRYDNLIEELGGKPTPAAGFATGIERIILNLKKQKIEAPDICQPSVFVAFLGDEAKGQAVDYVKKMHLQDIGAVLASGGRSLKSQMKQANARDASHVLIIGEEELKSGVVIWRDMGKGQQQTTSFDQALNGIKGSSI